MAQSCRGERYYDRWPTEADRCRKQEYGDWIRTFPWDWYATLTFSYELGVTAAEAVLARFIDELERGLKAPISYVGGKELHRYSGAGKPAVRQRR